MICEFRACPYYNGTIRFRPYDDTYDSYTVNCGKAHGEIRANHCPKQNNSTLDGWC